MDRPKEVQAGRTSKRLEGSSAKEVVRLCAHYLFWFLHSRSCIIHLDRIFRFWANWILKIFSDFHGIGYNKLMGILDNLENSWDDEFFFESAIYKPEMESLAAKLFSEICCDGCSCKSESDHQLD